MTTVSLEQWREHIETARARGMPLAHYAKEQGLSRYALYAANKTLRKRAQAASTPADQFVAVRVMPAPGTLRAELPNGVILHWSYARADDSMPLLQVLAALPCSR